MNNILVVNVNWVGDVIFSSPVFKVLKGQYPSAKVSCLAVPRVKDICESIPSIDEVILYDEKGRDRLLWGKWRIVCELKKRKFDAVFLLHRSWTRALLCYLAKIPVRVGVAAKERGKFLTHCVSPLKENAHRIDHYLNVLESFGIKISERSTEIDVPEADGKEIDAILKGNNISQDEMKIVCHVGANWSLKRWPSRNFVKLIDQLNEQFEAKVIIPGTKDDIPRINRIVAECKYPPVVLAGKTNLKQLMGLFKRADILISVDSGPLHMASSVGTKAVAVFGPTRPECTGPRGVGEVRVLQKDVGCNRGACYYLQCPDNICMKAVSVKDVIDAVKHFQH